MLTTGQPSTNPRLVKEADTLCELGFEVEAIGGFWSQWADRTDVSVLKHRAWRWTQVGGHPERDRGRFFWTRVRYWAGCRLGMDRWGLARVVPDLHSAASDCPADLYLAHNLGALPAAFAAARRHGGLLGYDAEDISSGWIGTSNLNRRQQLVEKVEREILPRCDSFTAASRGIADFYVQKYGLPRAPVVIHNVFPLRMRPARLPEPSTEGPLTLYWFSQTIGRGRGLEDVLSAMALLPGRTRLHLRGDWQPGYREILASCAQSLKIPPGDLVWHPPASPDEMARLASQYDVGLAVEPGRDANNDLTISNKIFTYLLAGTAIAATRTRGQAEVCRQLGEAAFCFDRGDTTALAKQLDRWSSDRNMVLAARQKSWQLGEERFNWDLEKSRFAAAVFDCLGDSGGAAQTDRSKWNTGRLGRAG